MCSNLCEGFFSGLGTRQFTSDFKALFWPATQQLFLEWLQPWDTTKQQNRLKETTGAELKTALGQQQEQQALLGHQYVCASLLSVCISLAPVYSSGDRGAGIVVDMMLDMLLGFLPRADTAYISALHSAMFPHSFSSEAHQDVLSISELSSRWCITSDYLAKLQNQVDASRQDRSSAPSKTAAVTCFFFDLLLHTDWVWGMKYSPVPEQSEEEAIAASPYLPAHWEALRMAGLETNKPNFGSASDTGNDFAALFFKLLLDLWEEVFGAACVSQTKAAQALCSTAHRYFWPFLRGLNWEFLSVLSFTRCLAAATQVLSQPLCHSQVPAVEQCSPFIFPAPSSQPFTPSAEQDAPTAVSKVMVHLAQLTRLHDLKQRIRIGPIPVNPQQHCALLCVALLRSMALANTSGNVSSLPAGHYRVSADKLRLLFGWLLEAVTEAHAVAIPYEQAGSGQTAVPCMQKWQEALRGTRSCGLLRIFGEVFEAIKSALLLLDIAAGISECHNAQQQQEEKSSSSIYRSENADLSNPGSCWNLAVPVLQEVMYALNNAFAQESAVKSSAIKTSQTTQTPIHYAIGSLLSLLGELRSVSFTRAVVAAASRSLLRIQPLSSVLESSIAIFAHLHVDPASSRVSSPNPTSAAVEDSQNKWQGSIDGGNFGPPGSSLAPLYWQLQLVPDLSPTCTTAVLDENLASDSLVAKNGWAAVVTALQVRRTYFTQLQSVTFRLQPLAGARTELRRIRGQLSSEWLCCYAAVHLPCYKASRI